MHAIYGDKSFSVSGSLMKYRRTHTGEKSYACDEYDKSFYESGTQAEARGTRIGFLNGLLSKLHIKIG